MQNKTAQTFRDDIRKMFERAYKQMLSDNVKRGITLAKANRTGRYALCNN